MQKDTNNIKPKKSKLPKATSNINPIIDNSGNDKNEIAELNNQIHQKSISGEIGTHKLIVKAQNLIKNVRKEISLDKSVGTIVEDAIIVDFSKIKSKQRDSKKTGKSIEESSQEEINKKVEVLMNKTQVEKELEIPKKSFISDSYTKIEGKVVPEKSKFSKFKKNFVKNQNDAEFTHDKNNTNKILPEQVEIIVEIPTIKIETSTNSNKIKQKFSKSKKLTKPTNRLEADASPLENEVTIVETISPGHVEPEPIIYDFSRIESATDRPRFDNKSKKKPKKQVRIIENDSTKIEIPIKIELLPEIIKIDEAISTEILTEQKPKLSKNQKRRLKQKNKIQQQKELQVSQQILDGDIKLPEKVSELRISTSNDMQLKTDDKVKLKNPKFKGKNPKIVLDKSSDISSEGISKVDDKLESKLIVPTKVEIEKKVEKPRPEPKKHSEIQLRPLIMPDDEVKKKALMAKKEEINYLRINPRRLLNKEQKNDNTINSFLNRIEQFILNEAFVHAGDTIVIAVSGGVDSVVLLDSLALISQRIGFSVSIAHYNHQLRGDSSIRDEKFVKVLSENYSIPFYHSTGNVRSFSQKNAISIEHAARTLRYNFLERTARTVTSPFVATGHTADDSAETFIFNLLRGTGLTGLRGIPSTRGLIKGVLLIRPLIYFHKHEILEYANLRKLKWFEDETNTLMDYTRNKIRLDLIPKLANDFNPKILETINRTARLIHGADHLIHEIVKKNIALVVTDATNERFTINLALFNTFNDFLKGEIIQTAFVKYFRTQALNLNTIDRILELENSTVGAICEINKNYEVLRDRESLIFNKITAIQTVDYKFPKNSEYKINNIKIVLTEVNRKEVVMNQNPNIEFFDADIVPEFLVLRNWQHGDTFHPIGAPGSTKMSDFLTNIKIPLIDKQKVLVLTNRVDVIWVVGKRLSDKFRVTPTTNRIYKAELIYLENN